MEPTDPLGSESTDRPTEPSFPSTSTDRRHLGDAEPTRRLTMFRVLAAVPALFFLVAQANALAPWVFVLPTDEPHPELHRWFFVVPPALTSSAW